jgi:hypothetical protein
MKNCVPRALAAFPSVGRRGLLGVLIAASGLLAAHGNWPTNSFPPGGANLSLNSTRSANIPPATGAAANAIVTGTKGFVDAGGPPGSVIVSGSLSGLDPVWRIVWRVRRVRI